MNELEIVEIVELKRFIKNVKIEKYGDLSLFTFFDSVSV